MCKISVIIPVYNAEKYLTECVDSVLTQTFYDFEVLLIDDGSSDNSGIICDSFLKIDSRIKVFHKANGGVSSARNLGISQAKGEWIVFVDSDDTLTPKILEQISSYKGTAELMAFNWLKLSLTGEILDSSNFMDEELPIDIFWTSKFSQKRQLAPWGYVYSSCLLKKNSISFNTDLIMSEDRLFNVMYFTEVKKVKCIGEIGYHYKDNQESVCNSRNSKLKAKSHINAANLIVNLECRVLFKKAVIADCLWNYIPTIIDPLGYYSDFYLDVDALLLKLEKQGFKLDDTFLNLFLQYPKQIYKYQLLKKKIKNII